MSERNIEKKYKKAVKFCEEGKFKRAENLLKEVVKNEPKHSDAYRILAQISEETGKIGATIDYLIESLNCNSENIEALMLMGNILARYKNAPDKALSYYESALKIEPNNYFNLSNIGGVLAQSGYLDRAKSYFEKALEIKKNFPNAVFGLALISLNQQDYINAFHRASKIVEKEPPRTHLFKQAREIMMKASKEVYFCNRQKVLNIVENYKNSLSQTTGKKVNLVYDKQITFTGKLEVAEYKKRDFHKVVCKEDDMCVDHIVMHELSHLDLIQEARTKDANMLFVSGAQHKDNFTQDFQPVRERLQKQGWEQIRIAGLENSLFEGINSQIYNTPLDLFIEDRLYHKFEDLRPIQFMSLYSLLQTYEQSVNSKEAENISTTAVRKANAVLIVPHILQFKELFAIDLPTFGSKKWSFLEFKRKDVRMYP